MLYRKFIATVLGAAVAVTGLTAAPARADNDAAKVIAGVAALAIIGAAVAEANKSKRPKVIRLSNPRSGNSAGRGSCIVAFPLDVGLRFGGPFFVDLDQHGADETQERVFAGKDPDLDGSPFEFLLDGALDRI